MKNFIKKVLSTTIALFLSGILLLLFFILSIVFLSSKNTSKDIKIKPNSILTLKIDGNVMDAENEIEYSIFNLKENKNILHYDLIKAIENAKNDDNIKGISIELDDINAGTTQIDDIRNALEDFKKSGKLVYAYGNIVSQPAYYLGSVAHQFFLNPAGNIELKGLSSEIIFFKDFAEKYGINMNIIRHGKFKAAVEPFLRNDMSAENREQVSTLLNDIWGETSNKIMQSRKISSAQFTTIVDSLYSVIPELSLKHKLVDNLLQKSEYDNFLKSKINLDKEEKINKISINQYIKTNQNTDLSSDKIAVLYASGTIYNGKELTNIHSERYKKYIQELAEDTDVKAVVLRVNSPGGSANASDEILFELQQLKTKKPLIVSFGDYAASGGYYIAMAADKIYAQNNTITGSIGVFGMIPDAKNLAEKNGIYSDVVSTNANSNMISPLSGISAGTLNILQKNVVQTYQRFIHFVATNRKKTTEQIDALGEGRVWSGKRAKELGLVDEIGNLNDAIKFAAKKANLNDFEVENYPLKANEFELLFGSMNEEQIATRQIKKQIGQENYRLFQLFTQERNRDNIQMIMPFSLNIR